jgi:hypothetical protein
MWDSVKEEIQLLKQLDAQCHAFGAESHCYEMGATLSVDEIAAVEKRLRCALPPELLSFYREIGNGIVGPHYGTVEAASLFIDHGRYIYIGEQGCGTQTFIIASGPQANHIAYKNVDETEFEDTATPFFAYFNQWLAEELAAFQEAKRLIDSGLPVEEIARALSQTHRRSDGRDLVASIINAPKPENLFGEKGMRIHHGASQNPWYESMLKQYRTWAGRDGTPRSTGRAPWWRIWK